MRDCIIGAGAVLLVFGPLALAFLWPLLEVLGVVPKSTSIDGSG